MQPHVILSAYGITYACIEYVLNKKWKRIFHSRIIYLSGHVTMQKKAIVTTADYLFLRTHTWTHSRHQMSLASHTSILFHSSFDLLHMSLIKPHPHIHTTTHIPKQPSKPKHHITHLILQLFPASSLTHFAHFVPDFRHTTAQFASIVCQASTRFHFYTSILPIHCLTLCAPQYISISFSNSGKSKTVPKTSRYRESRNE